MGVKRCFWLVLGGRGIPVAAASPFKGRRRKAWKCLAGSSLLADSSGDAITFSCYWPWLLKRRKQIT